MEKCIHKILLLLIKTNSIKPIKMTSITYFVFAISKSVQVYLIILIFTFTEIKTILYNLIISFVLIEF